MTRDEVGGKIHEIIQNAVMHSQGDWKMGFRPWVDQIFAVMGKLSPEVHEKPQVPAYDPKKVRRVGTLVQREKFTPEQQGAARAALRAVGLL